MCVYVSDTMSKVQQTNYLWFVLYVSNKRGGGLSKESQVARESRHVLYYEEDLSLSLSLSRECGVLTLDVTCFSFC